MGNPMMALLSQLHQAGPPAPPDKGLAALQEAIQACHTAISAMPDPAHTQMATQALALLTRIQRDLMQPQAPQGPPGAGGQ